MISRTEWDNLTPQQQYDQYTLLLSECGDRDEAEYPTISLPPIETAPDVKPIREGFLDWLVSRKHIFDGVGGIAIDVAGAIEEKMIVLGDNDLQNVNMVRDLFGAHWRDTFNKAVEEFNGLTSRDNSNPDQPEALH